MVSITRSGRPRTILLLLLLIILLPALLYTVYEITSLSASEELVGDLYRRQLDVVLFSLNQYSWDVASGWASTLTSILREGTTAGDPAIPGRLLEAAERTQVLHGIVLADSGLKTFQWFSTETGGSSDRIKSALLEHREKVKELPALRRAEYRKLEPLVLKEGGILLVFATGEDTRAHALVGMLVNDSAFVQQVLTPRITEAAGSDFVLAVTRAGTPAPLFVAGTLGTDEIRQQRQLWLFPDLSLGIRLAGPSLDEVVRHRLTRNIILIILVDLILIAGAIFVYRAFRRETELAKMKSDFVSTVSHELRTPLSLIRMYAETLEMGRLPDERKQREYLGTIVRETERLSHLVNNILNFARIDAGRKVYRFAPVRLNEIVTSVLETYAPHLREMGFDPLLELAAEDVTIHADGEAVKEGLVNLLDNAVKYSPGVKYLRVATGLQDETSFLEVEDHGIGIAPRHREKIFEMFYRVTEGDIHATKGSGLGLALVRHIMDAHHGTVTLQSTPGSGSTFRLTFPPYSTDKRESQ